MNRTSQLKTVFVLVVFGLVVCCSYYVVTVMDQKDFRMVTITAANLETTTTTKTIASSSTTYTPPLEPPMIYLTYGYIEPQFNPTSIETFLGHQCTTTLDHANINKSDAVVIRFSEAFEPNQFTLPESRRQDQMYVYMSLEPPWPFYNHDFRFVDKDFFNWTMTYRRDADVFFPYSSYILDDFWANETQREMFFGQKAVEQALSRKTSQSTALVAIGHCRGGYGPVQRLIYVKILEAMGLRIEKIGGCYNNVFPHPWDSDTFREYSGTFKFFLAFENGYHCRDYMTEKVLNNAIKSGTVPVIWGAPKEDIKNLLPAGSFIHTDDYESPKELVAYLNYLDSNATAYSEYFNWRLKELKEAPWRRDTSFNMLCNKLWEKRKFGNVSKIYHSFKNWFINQDNLQCFEITDANWWKRG